jgi:hypothetical protein
VAFKCKEFWDSDFVCECSIEVEDITNNIGVKSSQTERNGYKKRTSPFTLNIVIQECAILCGYSEHIINMDTILTVEEVMTA